MSRHVPRRSLSGLLAALAVFGPAMLLTIGFTLYALHSSQEQERTMFEAVARRTQSIIMQRMQTYINLLYAGRAFLMSGQEVSSQGWHNYVTALDISRRFPGIQGFGFTARLAPKDDHPERTAIRYLEPMDARNRAAIGFDMYATPVRRVAMAHARDSGMPTLTGKVQLIQEISPDKQVGFLIYLPVYRKGVPLGTVDDRRAALLGYVYAPFLADDLFTGLFGESRHTQLDFEIYDGPPRPETLIHDHNPEIHGLHPDPRVQRLSLATPVAGRTWTILFTATPTFDSETPERLAIVVFLSGTLVSLLLGGITWALASSRERAIVLAADMTAELREADRAKDDFLSVISHEPRTPLNFITGFGSILEDEVAGPLNSKQQEYLRKMLLGAERMLVLVNDLLDFAKIQAGKLDMLPTPTDFAPLVEEVHATLTPLAEQKNLTLATDVPTDLVLNVDGPRIVQVLSNLVGNSIKFTPPGGHIRIASRRDGNDLLTEVTDTGIGISAADQSKLFTRFRQLDMSSTRQVGGTGLGLSISKAIVEGHGGHIGVRSEKGKGSTFWFRLPLSPPSKEESP